MEDTVIKKQALYVVFLSIPLFQSWPKGVGMVEIGLYEFIRNNTNNKLKINETLNVNLSNKIFTITRKKSLSM